MSSAIALRQQNSELSPEQFELLKNTIAKGATNDELAVFVQVCNRLQLDPFARQIFLVKRWDKGLRREVATPQVSIDGFRLVADRTGKYAGQTEPEWCGEDGKWVNVWLSKKPPSAARVGVIRTDFKQPLYALALFDEYVPRTKEGQITHMWATKGSLMISKCAEALALRKAFPAELSGVYTTDEMGQADNDTPRAEVVASSSAGEPAKSAVEATKEKLRGKKASKLDDVLRRIAAAKTHDELTAVTADAGQLTGDDRGKAREAYARRKAQIEFADDEPPHDPETGELVDDQGGAGDETEAGARG
jgi:phage recombination protein Bet